MSLRDIERRSIYDFLSARLPLMGGEILDLGAGQQPYRDLIAPAGNYHAWDREGLPDNHVGDLNSKKEWRGGAWDTIVCTQVIQYVPDTAEFLSEILLALNPGGVLVMTGPTNWPVVQPWIDLRRWTRTGIITDLSRAGFVDIAATDRGSVSFEREKWSLGWGVTARSGSQPVAA